MKRVFVESSVFSKKVEEYGAMILKEIQLEILRNPEGGDLIQGTGGLRKIRFSDRSRNKGKRGGFRVIYLDLPHIERTYLLTVYGKSEKEDISPEEKKILKNLAAKLKQEAK